MKKRVLILSIVFLAFVFLTNAAPGDKIWEFITGDEIHSDPAIGSDGTIYVGSWDDKLYAITHNGKKKWDFKTKGDVVCSPAIGSDGTIYVGSCDDYLYAINPDGIKKWDFLVGDNVIGLAIAADGTIYVTTGTGRKVYAINPDGTKKWDFITDGDVFCSPAIGSDGIIYVGAGDNKLYAINPDGTKKWDYLTGGSVHSPAISNDDTIYVGSDSKLYAINPDGTKKWEFFAGQPIGASPAIDSSGRIYFGTRTLSIAPAKLFAINPDGTKKWEFEADDHRLNAPTIGNTGDIYVCSWRNTIYAIHSGYKQWEFTGDNDTQWMTTTPAIGSDGTVYVGSTDGRLYAIEARSTGLADSPWPKSGANAKNTGLMYLTGICGYLVPNDVIWGMCKIYVKVDSTNLNAENLYITIGDDMTKFAMQAMNESFQSSVSFNELIFSDTITTIKVWYNDKLYDAIDLTEGELYPGAQLSFEGLRFTSASENGRAMLYEMKPGIEKPVSTVKSFSVKLDGDAALKVDNPLGQSGALLRYENGRWICVSYSKEELVLTQDGDYALVNDTDGNYIPRITGNALKQNYPNPFNPETNIDFELEEGGHVTLEIFDSRGRKVITLVNGDYTSGIYTVHWAGKDARGHECASGIYYCILKLNGKRHIKKMVMLK